MRNKDVNIPKTAIIGSSGFLGRSFLSTYRKFHPNCVGTTRMAADENNNIFLFDLAAPDIKSLLLAKKGHRDALILAAVANIDMCEKERAVTRRVNVDGTLELISQLAGEGIKPIFFSTDNVFDGKNGAYADDAPANPIIEYGRQKAEVEVRIADITKGNCLVVRLSKVFSLVKGDGTLLDEMAHIFSSGETAQAAFDQIFCPTLITDVINAVSWLQANGVVGIVNVCSPEVWSRYDLAVSLAKTMGVDTSKVKKVSLDKIMMTKNRPKNTSITATAMVKSYVPFTPMAVCIKKVAGNWTKKPHKGIS